MTLETLTYEPNENSDTEADRVEGPSSTDVDDYLMSLEPSWQQWFPNFQKLGVVYKLGKGLPEWPMTDVYIRMIKDPSVVVLTYRLRSPLTLPFEINHFHKVFGEPGQLQRFKDELSDYLQKK